MQPPPLLRGAMSRHLTWVGKHLAYVLRRAAVEKDKDPFSFLMQHHDTCKLVGRTACSRNQPTSYLHVAPPVAGRVGLVGNHPRDGAGGARARCGGGCGGPHKPQHEQGGLLALPSGTVLSLPVVSCTCLGISLHVARKLCNLKMQLTCLLHVLAFHEILHVSPVIQKCSV